MHTAVAKRDSHYVPLESPARTSRLRVVAFIALSLSLVFSFATVAASWVYLSTRRIYQGHHWLDLWGSHGVHTLDLVVLAVEAVLVTLLVAVLVAGFSRRS